MPRGMKKDKLEDFYSGIEVIKNGVAHDPAVVQYLHLIVKGPKIEKKIDMDMLDFATMQAALVPRPQRCGATWC